MVDSFDFINRKKKLIALVELNCGDQCCLN